MAHHTTEWEKCQGDVVITDRKTGIFCHVKGEYFLGFEIKESEDTSNVYLVKDGTLFLLYGRKDFENMTHRRYEYIKGLNGHSEIALYVDTFEEVDMAYNNAIKNGAMSVLEPELEPWGQRTCYIADPEGNLIEIGSWNKVYEQKDL